MRRARTGRNGAAASCWALYREVEHSPGRVPDDAAILEAAGRRLEDAELSVEYRRPAEISGREPELPVLAFSMCEGAPALEVLRRWESRGVVVVNSSRAIERTHREKMIPLLEQRGVPMPESRLLDCNEPVPRNGAHDALFEACWVKQATEHKTREGDVVFARDAPSVQEGLDRLRGRGQPRAVLQRHVEGDLVKFYGVTDAGAAETNGAGEAPAPSWFQWFHPREHPVAGHSFAASSLREIASRAAAALGLDVWGGDAIVTADGGIFVIDVNAWPSFALYREEAADHIAAHLAARLRRMTRVAV